MVCFGHQNDAGQYHLLQEIGPGTELDLPNEVYLLRDNGCANRFSIMIRFKRDQFISSEIMGVQTAFPL